MTMNVFLSRVAEGLLAALLCAGCAPSEPGAAASRPAAGSADTTAAARAGLTLAQARRLAAAGVPVAVPARVPESFAVADVRTPSGNMGDATRGASYHIRYAASGGTCFVIEATTGGLGGPMPPEENRRTVDPPLFPAPAGQAYHVFWMGADPERPFPPRSLFSSWMEHERHFYRLTSGRIAGEDCRRLAPAAAVRIIESLQIIEPLQGEAGAAPTDTSGAIDTSLGLAAYDSSAWDRYTMNRPFAIVSEAGASPRAAALHVLDALDLRAASRDSQAVRTVRPAPGTAVVLITHLGLSDDSVAGVRYRVEMRRAERRWVLRRVGAQYRCQPGRGPRHWSKQRCL